ncbi:sigma-54 dependent transcriptional regulator [Isosphaeraceae bacterium EP7]
MLVADDDERSLKGLSGQIQSWGWRSTAAADARQLHARLAEEPPGLILLKTRLGEADGVELMREILGRDPGRVVVLMTDAGTIEGAVAAIKLGACDYLTRPIDPTRLQALIRQSFDHAEPPRRAALAAEPARLLGESLAIRGVRDLIRGVAPTDVTVLILGESGTGKEVVARSLHDLGPRRDGPFIALNMAALPRELVESTLFGHEKGAFTGADQVQMGACEAADGGTLFLDEIGEMDVALQAKLLRFIQDRAFHRVGSSKMRPVDIRILAATNRDPLEQVRRGSLREDLYYRLNVVPIAVPPLRDRVEDIPALSRHFLSLAAARHGLPAESISPGALNLLSRHDWPGNVRQLENLIERMVIFCREPEIGVAMLPPEIQAAPPAPALLSMGIPDLRVFDRIEKQAILDALHQGNGNVREAARILGLGQATVYRKVKRYNIQLG